MVVICIGQHTDTGADNLNSLLDIVTRFFSNDYKSVQRKKKTQKR